MNILHVSPSFHPAHSYGGPTKSLYHLCQHLGRIGCDVRVLTTDANGLRTVLDVPTDREVTLTGQLRVRYCRRLMRHSVSPALLRLLPSHLRWAHVVHLMAVYSFPTIPTLAACRVLDKPVVWSPRGALQRWRGSTRAGAKAVWERTCAVVAPQRIVFHATSNEEAEESASRFPGIEAVVIPNGVEIPSPVRHRNGGKVLRLLYLGRLHPIKGVENLLLACRMLIDRSKILWRQRIVGAGSPEFEEGIRQRIRSLGLSDRVTLEGWIDGEAKEEIFEDSDVVMVPSYKENFGMVVAEALAHGVPVIVSRSTPWKRVNDVGCGLCVDNDPESLFAAIERMSRMPLPEMGWRGREWMEKEFTWDRRAREMARLYQRLIDREDQWSAEQSSERDG